MIKMKLLNDLNIWTTGLLIQLIIKVKIFPILRSSFFDEPLLTQHAPLSE